MLKTLQPRLLPYMEQEMAGVQTRFRKGRAPFANLLWTLEHIKQFQMKVSLRSTEKLLSVWIMKNWLVLKETGVPQHLIILMCNFYSVPEAIVMPERGGTERLPVGKSVRQGYISFPCLLKSVCRIYHEQSWIGFK